MSVKKEVYLAVKKRVLNTTGVKHFALYNGQFDNLDDESIFPFPCVFMEFLDISYNSQAEGTQQGDTVLRFHVGFESVATEDLEILDLLEDIHLEVQGFSNAVTLRGSVLYDNEIDFFTPLNRVSETQDTNHDNITVWLMDYGTLLHDTSGHRGNKLVETKLTSLDVSADKDNYKPRLGKL